MATDPLPARLVGVLRAALAAMWIVAVSSAYIRLTLAAQPDAALGVARAIHRASASFTALAVIGLALLLWRSPALRARRALAVASGAALVLTLALSALGIAAGTTPSPAAQLGNLGGGLALILLLGWLHGLGGRPSFDAAHPAPTRLAGVSLALASLQAALGAALATIAAEPDGVLFFVHAFSGLINVSLALALGIRLAARGMPTAIWLLGLGLAVPVAGLASALITLAPAFALAHPALAVALLATIADAHARCALPRAA